MNKQTFNSPGLESETIEELTKKLIIANDALSSLKKEREMMLSNISHDLRAPVSAIRSTLDLIGSQKDMDTKELLEYIAVIDRRTKTMEALINDMHELFCIEDSSKKLELQTVNICSLLEEYYFDITCDSRFNEFELTAQIPENSEFLVKADIKLIIRILDNLFSNALKFTPKGGKITLGAESSDDINSDDRKSDGKNSGAESSDDKNSDGKNIIFYVSNTGEAIPKEYLPHIFNRTYTSQKARTPGSQAGSGLGLSIVKAAVERMGGRVSCTSNPDT
ncbi:MAG: HAMP domain-containing histidine kinase, partial [Lachnospiraceae bacterium]|nr:HAMP domain-containing histidine kinase [Lachnospiraceae bacterium]